MPKAKIQVISFKFARDLIEMCTHNMLSGS